MSDIIEKHAVALVKFNTNNNNSMNANVPKSMSCFSRTKTFKGKKLWNDTSVTPSICRKNRIFVEEIPNPNHEPDTTIFAIAQENKKRRSLTSIEITALKSNQSL